jgi:3'-phosphoadenosine 5'-phosphosulfate sulfotransferase (PAPS reductase)/FAD synthetase
MEPLKNAKSKYLGLIIIGGQRKREAGERERRRKKDRERERTKKDREG